MKKIKLLLIGLILAVGVNAQVWISGDNLQPAMFDTINPVTNLTENISSKYIVLKLEVAWDEDSVSNGVFYADSTLVTIEDHAARAVMNYSKNDIVKDNGYNFKTTDPDLVLYWIQNVYNPVLKSPSLQSLKANYKPHY